MSAAAEKIDTSTLNGIRCIACILIVIFHTHFILGALHFPTSSPCLNQFESSYGIANDILKYPIIVPVFWIISGFLCQHQLQERRLNTLAEHVSFIANRVARIYPLYAIVLLSMYVGNPNCTTSEFFQSAVFYVMIRRPGSPTERNNCVGAAWTLSADIHGYLALTFISYITATTRRRHCLKKIIILSLYSLALSHVIWTTYNLQKTNQVSFAAHGTTVAPRSALFGLENIDPIFIYDEAIRKSNNQTAYDFYPNIDFDSVETQTLQRQLKEFAHSLYFTSLDGNGAAMLLGAFLRLQILTPSKMSLVKLFIATAIALVFRGNFIALAIMYYLLLDLILRHSNNRLLAKVFSNKLWDLLIPYTYGIYLFHLLSLVTILIPRNNMEDFIKADCSGYNLGVLVKSSVAAFTSALVIAMVLHHGIEVPVTRIRKKEKLK